MGLWKDQIDAEIGQISWNKQGVYDKLNSQKRRGALSVVIPSILAISIAILLVIISFPRDSFVTSSDVERASLEQKMQYSKIKAYYYSAFVPMDHYRYYGGLNDSYLGMKKGDKIEELTLHLSNLKHHEYHPYYGHALGKDVVVHFEDGSIAKLRIGASQVYDVETGSHYVVNENKYYHIFQGETAGGIAINKWFHAIFLILIGINFLLFKLLKQPFTRKIVSLVFHLFILIVTWKSIFNTFDGDYLLSKTMLVIWFCCYVALHICFLWIGKYKGQEFRFEVYKMVLYIGALLIVWNQFFF